MKNRKNDITNKILSIDDFLNKIKLISSRESFHFNQENIENNIISLKLSPTCGFWIICLIYIYKNEFQSFIQFSVRSTSWDLPGEKTDIHDIVSQLFACWLRIISPPTSSNIWEVEHPIAQIPGEIYARRIIPEQPSIAYSLDDNFVKLISTYLEHIHIFEFVLKNCWNLEYNGEEIKEDFSFMSSNLWINRIRKLTSIKIKKEEVLIYKRISPTWTYLRSFSKNKRFSILSSKEFGINLFKMFNTTLIKEVKKIETPNGQIFFSESNGVGNFISQRTIRLILQLHSAVDKRIKGPIFCVPISNSVISFRKNFIICIYSDCSRKSFEIEKKQLEFQHTQIRKVLFDKIPLQLIKNIDDEEFEQLCYDLLEREAYVLWIRRLGKSRDRDEGCDLLCNFLTNPIKNSEIEFKEERPSKVERKIVVQCKVASSGLSKNKVTDIRDTIEFHGADGYLLICSSYITSSLAQHLLRIKNENKNWIDWWTSREIESKLNLYPDLLKKYKHLTLNN